LTCAPPTLCLRSVCSSCSSGAFRSDKRALTIPTVYRSIESPFKALRTVECEIHESHSCYE
jgi:hypothetical protein